MKVRSREIDVARNLKMVDWLKAELVEAVAELFKTLLKSGSEAVCDAVATIIILTYMLGQKVGVSFHSVDAKVKSKLQVSLDESLDGEGWQESLADLLNYLEKTKR